MYNNILIPVALGDHDSSASFEAARALADDGAKLTVLHVEEAIPAYVASEIPEDLLKSTRAQIANSLKKTAAGLPGARAALVVGHAGRTIIDYATEHGTDCIVIASHKPGIQDYFLGSTASRVVRHAPCSVHVIR